MTQKDEKDDLNFREMGWFDQLLVSLAVLSTAAAVVMLILRVFRVI